MEASILEFLKEHTFIAWLSLTLLISSVIAVPVLITWPKKKDS